MAFKKNQIPVSRLRVTKAVRPLTEQEIFEALKLSGTLQSAVEQMDKLKKTDLYVQEVKFQASNLNKTIEGYLLEKIWRQEVETVDIVAALEQQAGVTQAFDGLFSVCLMSGEMEKVNQPAFWADMNELFIKHGINLRLNKDGDLRIDREARKVEGGER